MSFPCKEEYVVFEKLAREQVQIYGDSCDYGVRLRDVADVDFLRRSLNELIKFYKRDPEYRVETWHKGRSVQMFIPFEVDSGVESGVRLKVAFSDDHQGGFITIDIEATNRRLVRRTS